MRRFGGIVAGELRLIFPFLSLAGVGVGSALFHGTGLRSAQLLDEVPMLFVVLSLAYNLSELGSPPGKLIRPWLAWLCVLFVVAFIVLYLVVDICEFPGRRRRRRKCGRRSRGPGPILWDRQKMRMCWALIFGGHLTDLSLSLSHASLNRRRLPRFLLVHQLLLHGARRPAVPRAERAALRAAPGHVCDGDGHILRRIWGVDLGQRRVRAHSEFGTPWSLAHCRWPGSGECPLFACLFLLASPRLASLSFRTCASLISLPRSLRGNGNGNARHTSHVCLFCCIAQRLR